MNIKRNRLENLLLLMRGYPRATHFARAANISEGYLSQIVNGSRSLGEEKAREIEQALGLEYGSLDRPRDAPITTLIGAIAEDAPAYEAVGIQTTDDHKISASNSNIRYTAARQRKPAIAALEEKNGLVRDLLDADLSAEQVRTIRSYLAVVAAQP